MQINSSEQKVIMFWINDKKAAILIAIAVFLIVVDRVMKVIALNYLTTNPFIITSRLKLSTAVNTNVAFSIPVYGTILTLIIIILILGLIWYFVKMIKNKQAVQASLLFFVILGSASNLADRFLHNGVIDYINVERFTIFNIADVMILFGIIFFIRTGIKRYAKQPLN
ncbi:MAG: signal peptidase II [bacterium]